MSREPITARPTGKPLGIDGIAERHSTTLEYLRQSEVRDDLKRLYDAVAEEPIPDDMKELLGKLR